MAVDDIRSTNNIKSLRIGLASPEKIISWSHGEVKKPETFNYRTYKPEKDGLFCERIFGPVKDYECACGKYKKKRYKAVVCERCGVEVTSNRVRREHLGHIRLASPVAHIWFTKSIPNRFSALLGISGKEIEKVIYFVSWLVADVDEKWVEEKHDGIKALVEKRLKELDSEQLELRNLAQLDLFEEAKTAEGLESARKREITMLGKALRGDYGSSSPLRATAPREHNGKYEEKLESLKDLLLSQEVLKPYILAGEVVDRDTGEVIAVSKDRFNYALLSKVIYLGKYELTVEKVEMEIEATKRIEEIEGERRAIVSALDLIKSMKPLDRLTDQEHEDYNALRMFCLMRDMGDLDEHFHIGIGALVVQESLRKLDLPGIEKEIMGELEGATSAKKQKLIKRLKVVRAFLHSGNRPEWMILTVLPVLPPELRPMVELEGGRFASSDLNDLYRRVINRNNRLKKLIDIRAPESILRNERRMLQEAVDALIDNGRKGRAAVNVNNRALKSLSDMLKGKQGRFRQNLLGKRVDYSGRSVIVVGPKLRLHQCGLPKYMALELFKPFVLNKLIDPDDPNQHIARSKVRRAVAMCWFGSSGSIISEAYQECGPSFTARLADAIKDLGFEMATVSGITISASDIVIPREKKAILSRATKEADDVWSKRKKGIITEAEKDLEVTRIWDQATKDLTKAMRDNFGRFNSVYMMAESGARGKMDQVRQLAAMRGLLVGPSGRVLDFPIKSNFREGLSVFEYFISTHGGRKGLVDTALKTADSGYLTRRLIDVSLDVSVTTNDCGTKDGIELDLSAADSVKKLKKMLVGRTCAQDLVDKKTGETVLAHDDEIDNSRAEMIHILQPPTLKVRSVLACQKLGGVCVKCYGWDLASGKAAQVGDPVGVIAAQSIGEPGTQLTMRTFHTGGIKGRDITQGLPYVEMLFEVRGVKMPSILADEDGEVVSISEMVYERITVQSRDEQKEKVYDIVHPYKERLRIHFRSHVERDSPLDNAETVLAEFDGIVTQLVENKHKTYWIIKVKVADGSEHEYETAHENRRPLVAVGEKVKRGDQLCEGDLDLRKFHALLGDLPTQLYITNKIQEIYESQNVNTNSKHIEVIAKQMIRYVEITNPGDEENLFEGDLVDKTFFRQLCQQRAAEGKKEPEGNSLLQGISKSSLSTESFLAAASFQETTRVLTEAAIEGKIDNLKGLKENVIIGGLIPVGTGWHAVAHEEAAFQAVFGAKKRPAKEKPPAKDDKPAEKVF